MLRLMYNTNKLKCRKLKKTIFTVGEYVNELDQIDDKSDWLKFFETFREFNKYFIKISNFQSQKLVNSVLKHKF